MTSVPDCAPDDLFTEQRGGKWFVFEFGRFGWHAEADTEQEIVPKLRELCRIAAVYRALIS